VDLRIKRVTKNKIVSIELNTFNFTQLENKMLDELGEPVIEFNKTYGSNAITFSKRIRSGFKVKVKFDASLENDTDKTAEYISNFLDELKEKLSEAMSNLSFQYNEDLKTREEVSHIDY
jgi:hypothetical protein